MNLCLLKGCCSIVFTIKITKSKDIDSKSAVDLGILYRIQKMKSSKKLVCDSFIDFHVIKILFLKGKHEMDSNQG